MPLIGLPWPGPKSCATRCTRSPRLALRASLGCEVLPLSSTAEGLVSCAERRSNFNGSVRRASEMHIALSKLSIRDDSAQSAPSVKFSKCSPPSEASSVRPKLHLRPGKPEGGKT